MLGTMAAITWRVGECFFCFTGMALKNTSFRGSQSEVWMAGRRGDFISKVQFLHQAHSSYNFFGF